MTHNGGFILHGLQWWFVGLRTRVSGRAGTTFGALLCSQILIQLTFYIVHGEALGKGDFRTVLGFGADLTYIPYDPLFGVLMSTLPLEILFTLLYLVSRWVSVAFLAYAFAWSVPFLILVNFGPGGPWPIHIALPLVMLVDIHFWTLEDGPRVSNPFPGRVPEPFR